MITSTSVRRAALIAALVAVPGLHAAEVAGVRVADSIKVGNSELVLNGAGLRSKLFMAVSSQRPATLTQQAMAELIRTTLQALYRSPP